MNALFSARAMLRLSHRVVSLALKEDFRVSRETYKTHDALIVALSDGQNTGYGEATAFSVYGATIEGMLKTLGQVQPLLKNYEFTNPEKLWSALAPELHHDPFVQCALDVAAYDLWGKREKQPLYRLWGLSTERTPISNYSIGIDTIDNMVKKLKELQGWPVLKIKLGSGDDVAIIRELRRHTNARFRVDANCGWGLEETLAKAQAFRNLGVEFIEQPLPRDDWEGMRRLYPQCALPLMADESCAIPSDIQRCHGAFHGINIKLMKCGGITPARKMIRIARNLDMKVMVGCMPESSIGVSAIAQLAPLLDFVDIDSIALLDRDIATGVKLDHGRIVYPTKPGCGTEILEW